MRGSGLVTAVLAILVMILSGLLWLDGDDPGPGTLEDPAAVANGSGVDGTGEEAAPAVDAAAAAVAEAAARADARIAPWMRPLAPGEKPPQFVLFSFDGAGSHEHWQRIRTIAAASEARVTGFLSGLYLLRDDERTRYVGPGHKPGKSSIGFGGTAEEVSTLVTDLNVAKALGHEIGTHYNGHFCAGSEPSGRTWSQAMWADELGQFRGFVESARTGLGLQVEQATIRGGRTPCLEGDWAQAYPAMAAAGLHYDTSRISDGIVWPQDVPTASGPIREYFMPTVRVPALGRKVVLMDYNLWFTLNGAKDQPARAGEFQQVTLGAYRASYEAALAGNRAPLVIGNHFNEWSGGGFSRAVETFLAEVCTKPDTVCATYSQVDKWIDLQDPAVLGAFRAMPAAQVPDGR